MPRYSCKAVLREKLSYAIHFCKSIDNDEYARVAAPPEILLNPPADPDLAASQVDTWIIVLFCVCPYFVTKSLNVFVIFYPGSSLRYFRPLFVGKYKLECSHKHSTILLLLQSKLNNNITC